jgi:Flp pilus assembly protein protease CpaA
VILNELSLLAPTLLLLIASCFDVKTGRFPNWLFLSSTGASLIFLIFSKSAFLPIVSSFIGASVVLFALSPLFFFGILGAGDVKLMSVFCLLTSPSISLSVFAYSLFWGLLMGVLKLTFSGHLVTFAQSFLLRNPQTSQQKIPYTIALLLGWLCYLSVGGLA